MTSINSITTSPYTHQPQVTSTPPQDQGSTIMATGGETLESLADEHDVSLEALERANPHLSSDEPLSFGDQVNIPPKAADAPMIDATVTRTMVPRADHRDGNGGSGAPWMDVARKQLGTKEIPGARDNGKIVDYMQSISKNFKDDETPWCSGFVNWSLEKGGVKGTDSGWASSWLNWGDKTSLKNAKPGDVVVVRTGSGPQDYHVGFFVSQQNGQVKLLGGNQRGGDPNTTGKVCYSTYSASSVAGVRRPDRS